MKIEFLPGFVKASIQFYCPNCSEEMEIVYISDMRLVCKKCKEVYELHLRKSPYTIEKIRADGWLTGD